MSVNVDQTVEKISQIDIKKDNNQNQSSQKKSKKEDGKFLLKAPKVNYLNFFRNINLNDKIRELETLILCKWQLETMFSRKLSNAFNCTELLQ